MRRLLVLMVAATGVLAPAAATVAPAMATGPASGSGPGQGSIGIRLAEAPSNRADDPRAKIYIVDHLPPGATIRRLVEVSNDTDVTRRIQLYAAGADITGGQFTFRPGREAGELSQWTKVEPGQLDLGPRTKGAATVTIRVPARASAGERYAVVWAETSTPAIVGQVAVVSRVGVRVYLSVGPGGEPASSFVVSTPTARRGKDGRPVVEAKVTNTGGRAVQLSGSLQLANGPGGLSAGPFAVEAGTTIAPGQSAVVAVVLDASMPLGPWEARLVLQSGTFEVPATAQITFPAEAGSAGRAVGSKEGSSDEMSVEIALSAVLVVVAVLVLLAVRRRRRRDHGDHPVERPARPALAGSLDR